MWEIHEVKMSTSVKEVNLDDVAVQHYVLSRSGLRQSVVSTISNSRSEASRAWLSAR